MVTRRARRWFGRGVAAAVVLVLAGTAAATWFTSEMIEDDLLTPPPEEAAPADDPTGLPVELPGPLGDYAAHRLAGSDDTWVLFVPDAGGSRGPTEVLAGTAAELGLPTLVTTYRNRPGAPEAAGGRHLLGVDEWADLEAAVTFALGSGARDVVLVGFGTGGAVVLTFVRQSGWADRVAGMVLDSPYLEPGTIVDDRAAADNVPGFLAGWGKAVAKFRFGIDWALLDQVSGAADLDAPILLIQGTADARLRLEVADAFAVARPELIEYLKLLGAGHMEGYTSHPDRYVAAVAEFLGRVAVGSSDLPPVEPGETEPE